MLTNRHPRLWLYLRRVACLCFLFFKKMPPGVSRSDLPSVGGDVRQMQQETCYLAVRKEDLIMGKAFSAISKSVGVYILILS